MKALVGNTGFVGSNIALNMSFDRLYNSKNISESYQTNPKLLIYCGIPAEKFLANNNPERDLDIINEGFENIRRINPERLVLISTIDVFKNSIGKNEDYSPDAIEAYGSNRGYLENLCRSNFEKCHIIRLPGLFGENLKKNFLYDLIQFIPKMLKEYKYFELSQKEEIIKDGYVLQENGFYLLDDTFDKEALVAAFKHCGFSALNFTDSRAIFQFYNLSRLSSDIETVIKHNIPTINMATEPILTSEIYREVMGEEFENEIMQNPPHYDFITKYAKCFGGSGSYIEDKKKLLSDIVNFTGGKR